MSTTTKTTTAYWLPTTPLTPIDLINRRAEGSPEEWPATRKRWLDARNARVAAHRAAAQGCDR